MRTILATAVALLVAHNALAAEAVIFRHQTPEGSWDFDAGSIVVVDESIRRSQMVLNLKKPLQDQPTGNQYDRVVFMYEHDCRKNQMRVTDTTAYLRGERVEMGRASNAWRAAGESVAQQYACALVQK
jgi:hypothetical protein